MNISENVREYLSNRHPEDRYTSFDYCYNYFMQFSEQDNIQAIAYEEYIQNSCLQLGFYLASWGMLRGSSFLLQKSLKHFESLIVAISDMDRKYWDIDVDKYTHENIELLLELYHKIMNYLGHEKEYASATLITKIMLGVFGNIPALDDNFCRGMGFSKYLSKSLLLKIAQYYQDHRQEISEQEIKTLDFHTGRETGRYYTKAKIIDMIGFIEGMRINKGR